VGAALADIDTLAQPENARLLFAGEATSSLYYGYVHGGVVSGAREATRLLGGAEAVLESGVIASAGC
jgi:monoamine oxidase